MSLCNNPNRIEVGVEVFNEILERCSLDKIDPKEWKPQPEYTERCFIEIWSDGTVYGVDGMTKTSYDLFYQFFEKEEQWRELQEEIEQIKKEETTNEK